MKMFVAAFSEELSSVLTRRSVVTTEEEHHVSLFGHSEGGLQIEEVSNTCACVIPFTVMESYNQCFFMKYVCWYSNAPFYLFIYLCMVHLTALPVG
jgi:hypothetical protein